MPLPAISASSRAVWVRLSSSPWTRTTSKSQVLAVDPGRDDLHVLAAELLEDVVDDLGGGGGGQRQDPRVAERLDRFPQVQVAGAEVVPPLRDAMRLVDHEDVDAVGAQGRQKLRLGEPLRGDEDELPLLLLDLLQDLALLAGSERAVDLGGVDADLLQLVHLVLHQGDQGRDDDRGAGELGPGELVAQGLAGAGRHDGQGVLAGEDGLDDLLLPLAEGAEPEGPAQAAVESGNLYSLGHGSSEGSNDRAAERAAPFPLAGPGGRPTKRTYFPYREGRRALTGRREATTLIGGYPQRSIGSVVPLTHGHAACGRMRLITFLVRRSWLHL